MQGHFSSCPLPRVLLTGVTGYVGGRLAPRLLDAGYRVRCVVRNERKLRERGWAGRPGVEVVECDLGDTKTLTRAMGGCEAAYYLVHSMQAAGAAYASEDRRLAASFAQAARHAQVGRIIYLGGLGETGQGLSEHLSSRREVEKVLADSGVPVTTFRAAMIIGSGSASFEILRYLVERLPVMITPRWVTTESQPIAIGNVLHYLTECLNVPATIGGTFDIGGPDVLSYRALMRVMTRALGLTRRIIISVPLLTPRLSSGWIHLVTPINYRLARPLAEGLRNRVVCRDQRAAELMPQRLLTVREAIEAAVHETGRGEVDSAWSDAGVVSGDPDWAGGRVFRDRREVLIRASRESVFQAVCKVGGGHGYYAADRLWRLRGVLDRLVGGPGLRRGRRHPHNLAYGDALDFWRVAEVSRPSTLRLVAEMKLPGVAELAFEIDSVPTGEPGVIRLVQTARFKPRGLMGLLYWYTVLPLHGVVFRGMLDGIRREAEKDAPPANQPSTERLADPNQSSALP